MEEGEEQPAGEEEEELGDYGVGPDMDDAMERAYMGEDRTSPPTRGEGRVDSPKEYTMPQNFGDSF